MRDAKLLFGFKLIENLYEYCYFFQALTLLFNFNVLLDEKWCSIPFECISLKLHIHKPTGKSQQEFIAHYFSLENRRAKISYLVQGM